MSGILAPHYHLNLIYKATSTTYPRCGGASNDGSRCGVFFVTLGNSSGATNWYAGAAISFNLWYYFSQSSGAHYVRRGGRCTNGFNCGFAYISLYDSFSTAGWYSGAALSFKPYIKLRVLHMHIVVVSLGMTFIVVALVLTSTTTIIMPAGVLALPYHLNKGSYYCDYFSQSSGTRYSIRGGNCSAGSNCGFVYVHLSVSFSNYSWNRGAAISFKPSLLFIVIIFIKVVVLTILIVVVFLQVGSVVAFSMLIWTVLLLGLVGILAPPYHLNKQK